MRVLVAPSCFKESLSAERAARAMARGVRRALPHAEIRELPMIDGGEGFARTLADREGGQLVSARARGPLGEPRECVYAVLDRGVDKLVVIEAAEAIGLRHVLPAARDPNLVDSAGVGDLLRHALDAGHRRFLLGVGDTATNDGGAGLLLALGARFYDESGRMLEQGCPSELASLATIDVGALDPRLRDCTIEVACNPTARLVGPRGTSHVFARHKGAAPAQIESLEQAMNRFVAVAETATAATMDVAGAGAGGGMASALRAFCGARLRDRYEVLYEYLPVEAELERAQLVVTGEGRLDETSVLGKVPVELARRARARGVPVVAIVGQAVEAPSMESTGLSTWAVCQLGRTSLAEALRDAEGLLEDATARAFSTLRGARPDSSRREKTPS